MQQPGTLVLVVGPSGVGKDSLIDVARARLAGQPVVFPRRVITRDPEAGGEDFIACTRAEFDRRERAGRFCLSWHAHGLSYGVPVEAEAELARGASVVANVSRTVLPEAERRAARLLVLHVTARAETLARRLAARGRESEAEIRARLERAEHVRTERCPVVIVENDGALEAAAQAFTEAIRRHALSAEKESAPG